MSRVVKNVSKACKSSHFYFLENIKILVIGDNLIQEGWFNICFHSVKLITINNYNHFNLIKDISFIYYFWRKPHKSYSFQKRIKINLLSYLLII